MGRKDCKDYKDCRGQLVRKELPARRAFREFKARRAPKEFKVWQVKLDLQDLSVRSEVKVLPGLPALRVHLGGRGPKGLGEAKVQQVPRAQQVPKVQQVLKVQPVAQLVRRAP